jgi:hypothetical protein
MDAGGIISIMDTNEKYGLIQRVDTERLGKSPSLSKIITISSIKAIVMCP